MPPKKNITVISLAEHEHNALVMIAQASNRTGLRCQNGCPNSTEQHYGAKMAAQTQLEPLWLCVCMQQELKLSHLMVPSCAMRIAALPCTAFS